MGNALGAELSDHPGYERGDPTGRGTGNSRNGHSDKRVLTEDGEVNLAVPRDRNGTFEPAIVPKEERRLAGFDDHIVSLYARGMTVREIRGHLEELYGVAVSPDLISRVTDAVLEEVREWQNRPLDPVCPVKRCKRRYTNSNKKKPPKTSMLSGAWMVAGAGFEPATSRL